MKSTRFVLPILGIVAILSSVGFYAAGTEEPKEPIGRINVSALGKMIDVVGDLGEPLETLHTLRGEMVEADYFASRVRLKAPPDPSLFVRVRQVGDRKLDEPVVIKLQDNWHRGRLPKPGAQLELIGYAKLVYEGDSPIEKRWGDDPRNRHEVPKRPEVARVVVPGHYDDQFVILQFDELPAEK